MLPDIYTFMCDMPIVAKARARSTVEKSSTATNGFSIRHYTPAKTANFEEELALRVSRWLRVHELPIAPKVALEVWLEFHHKRPANNKLKHKVTKPDCDNIAKSVLDALNEVLYHDDSYVTDLHILKRFNDVPKDRIKISFQYREKVD